MKHDEAQTIAKKWLYLLSPFCERIEIAGSIRRGKPEVKDIDLVAIPKMQVEQDLFGGPGTTINLLEAALQKLFWDRAYLATIKNGPKYKQLALIEGLHLELWMVTPPAQFGVLYLIRTGPEDFGHWCVTQKNKGGALPSYLHFKGGAIWDRAQKIETPEESDVFRLIGMEYIEPGKRVARWMGMALNHG